MVTISSAIVSIFAFRFRSPAAPVIACKISWPTWADNVPVGLTLDRLLWVLRRVLSSYSQYHHDTRTHRSLGKDCPRHRPIQTPSAGNIIAFPEVGGLHHRYERRAA
jgi:hypothetical protein